MGLKDRLCKKNYFNSIKTPMIILNKYKILFNKHPLINSMIISFVVCLIISAIEIISNPPVKVNLTLNMPKDGAESEQIINSAENLEKGQWIESGFYEVGKDIEPGEYLASTSKNEYELAYVAAYEDSKKSFDKINFNDRFRGCNYVTLKKGEFFEIDNCSMIKADKANLSIAEDGYYNDGIYRDGMYKVGIDIPQGEYTVTSTERMNAYFEIDSNSRHQKDSIITSDSFKGDKKISLTDGQYIELKKCKIQIK